MNFLRALLAHPLVRGLDVDDPATTNVRRSIVLEKPFLRKVYLDWYDRLASALPAGEGPVLEIGSGAGFFAQVCPDVVASEVFLCEGISCVADAQQLPFADGSLRAIVMTDVMHHIPDVERFLREAARTLSSGGRLLMVEPWVSAWSTFVYTRFHPEPFRPQAADWRFPSAGPLSGANGALPWIVFHRDAEKFRALCPELSTVRIEKFMPFRYLVSGGVSLRSLSPGWTHGLWGGIERLLAPAMDWLAMFAFIVIERR